MRKVNVKQDIYTVFRCLAVVYGKDENDFSQYLKTAMRYGDSLNGKDLENSSEIAVSLVTIFAQEMNINFCIHLVNREPIHARAPTCTREQIHLAFDVENRRIYPAFPEHIDPVRLQK